MRVPTVDGPSVALNPAPNAYQTTPQALGGAGMVRAQQLGQAAQLGAQVVEMQQKQQNRDDIDAVFRAETALKDDYLKFEREELGKQGVNAKGAAERAAQWWGEATKYGEGLTERQAHAFRRSATQLRLSSSSTLGRHEQHQANEALKESAQARIGTAVNMAIADPVPERVAAARKEIAEAVSIAGNLAGYPPEVTQAKMSEALTLMHRGVVMQMVDNDPDAAKAYYYTNKKEIAGATRATIEKALERGGRLQKAQEAADQLVAKFGDDVPAAMAHIEKTYQGEDEQAIKAEFNQRFTTIKTTKQAMSQTAYETAMLHTVQGQKVPAAVWSQMDDGHKAAIIEKREAEAKARRAESEGKAVKTDFGAWDKINRMVTDDPKAFVSFDLGRMADKISRGDLQQFADLQRKLRTNDDKPLKEAVSLAQQIDVVVDGLRLNGTANDEKRSQLRKSIHDALIAEQQGRKKGEELTYDERQKVIDRQIMQVTIPGFIWDTTKRAYELKPGEAEKAKIVVPDDDRKLIIQALKAKGRPTDEPAIIELYRRQKGL